MQIYCVHLDTQQITHETESFKNKLLGGGGEGGIIKSQQFSLSKSVRHLSQFLFLRVCYTEVKLYHRLESESTSASTVQSCPVCPLLLLPSSCFWRHWTVWRWKYVLINSGISFWYFVYFTIWNWDFPMWEIQVVLPPPPPPGKPAAAEVQCQACGLIPTNSGGFSSVVECLVEVF